MATLPIPPQSLEGRHARRQVRFVSARPGVARVSAHQIVLDWGKNGPFDVENAGEVRKVVHVVPTSAELNWKAIGKLVWRVERVVGNC